MVEFERSITAAEVRSYYLNLTTDHGHRFGAEFPEHRTRFIIIDGKGRATSAQKHNNNQIWGMLKNWFIDNDIHPGDRVKVRFDLDERSDGKHIVNLIPEITNVSRPSNLEEDITPSPYAL